jgi:hypothetical protein
MTAPGTMFRATRDVPQAWTDDLASIFPPSATVPYPVLFWHAGIEYQPTQRWVLYLLEPVLARVPDYLLEACQGRDPREWGEWVSPEIVQDDGSKLHGEPRWVTESFISHEQWVLFRETHCYPQLFWIIQGDQGGHRWRLTELEQAFLRSIGREDADTPMIGELPYAQYDNRVREKLLQMDKLRRWKTRLDREGRFGATATEAGLIVRGDRTAQRKAYAAQTLDWLDSQITDAVSDIPQRVLNQLMDSLPTSDVQPDAENEAIHQTLLERA